jgi:hypothetical protein
MPLVPTPAPLETSRRVTKSMPLGCPLPLAVVIPSTICPKARRSGCNPSPKPNHNHQFCPNTEGTPAAIPCTMLALLCGRISCAREADALDLTPALVASLTSMRAIQQHPYTSWQWVGSPLPTHQLAVSGVPPSYTPAGSEWGPPFLHTSWQ